MKKRTWIHRMSNIDKTRGVGDCAFCGKDVPIVLTDGTYKCKSGRMYHAHKNQGGRHLYRDLFKFEDKWLCGHCNIEFSDIRFFDVNHIDCNHKNNERSNLILLCPNCHRMETIKLWNSLKKVNVDEIKLLRLRKELN